MMDLIPPFQTSLPQEQLQELENGSLRDAAVMERLSARPRYSVTFP